MVVDMILWHSLFNFDRISSSSENDIQIFQGTTSSFGYLLAERHEIEDT